MYNLDNKIKQQYYNFRNGKDLFRDEEGAIDLASIMVGVIVIGLIGGVIAATVFAVIPWAQDNAAKQQLDSIVQAENAYFGLSAADPSPLPTGYKSNSFAKSAELANAKLLTTGPRYCVTTPDDSKSYTGYSQSSSGTIWTVTDKNSKPEPLVVPSGTKAVDSLPVDCQFITEGIADNSSSTPIVTPTPSSTAPTPYIDPTPTITKMTFKCDVTTSGITPLRGSLTGKETWSDGTTATTVTYNNSLTPASKTLNAGVEYTMVFDGTYLRMQYISSSYGPASLNPCLISVDHWGSATGTSNAQLAFDGAVNLSSVPDHIPSTITIMRDMFKGATKFNGSGVSSWDVSKVTDMSNMFMGNTSFNQPLNNWNTSKVTNMTSMFDGATNFNQPLNNWNVSNVTSMEYMFRNTSLDQPLSNWNTGNATNMHMMFFGAPYQQDLSSWNMDQVNRMAFMFTNPKVFNGNIQKITHSQMIQMTFKCDVQTTGIAPLYGSMRGVDSWSDGTTISYDASLTAANKTLKAGVEYTMIYEGTFSRLQRYSSSTSLNNCLRSLDFWGNATGATNAQLAFSGATNLIDVPDEIPSNITTMKDMFSGATSFNDSSVKNWDVSKVTNMGSMFAGATAFSQDLSGWNTAALTPANGTLFAPASFPDGYLPSNTSK